MVMYGLDYANDLTCHHLGSSTSHLWSERNPDTIQFPDADDALADLNRTRQEKLEECSYDARFFMEKLNYHNKRALRYAWWIRTRLAGSDATRDSPLNKRQTNWKEQIARGCRKVDHYSRKVTSCLDHIDCYKKVLKIDPSESEIEETERMRELVRTTRGPDRQTIKDWMELAGDEAEAAVAQYEVDWMGDDCEQVDDDESDSVADDSDSISVANVSNSVASADDSHSMSSVDDRESISSVDDRDSISSADDSGYYSEADDEDTKSWGWVRDWTEICRNRLFPTRTSTT